MRLRDRLGISERTQRLLARAMEVGLLGFFFIGLDRGEPGIMVNAGVGLAVARLPSILERDFGVPMDPALTLWLTSAVFLHGVGVVGIPGTGLGNLYQSLSWWDHVTHALSSSVVAGAGYATARAVDVHSEEVTLPPKFMFVFILLVVLAFGVFWEVIEFTLAEGAALVGTESVLTQYGLDDTMLDLVFDAVGAVVVATWGTAHLVDVSDAIVNRFETRETEQGGTR